MVTENETLSFDIPYIKLTFGTVMTEDTRMPSSKVSALRGGMGEMLLRQNCVADRKCEKCSFKKVCVVRNTLYSYMEKKPPYITGDESVGYLLECEDERSYYKKGDAFFFHLILFGNSIAFFNSYLQALTYLGMIGLGKERSKFRIREILNTKGKRILFENQITMRKYEICNLKTYVEQRKQELFREDGHYRICFQTPLSMKFMGEYLQEFHTEAILKGVFRRIQMLNYYLGEESEQPELDHYPKIVRQTVNKQKVKRYSSTHGEKMILIGIIGEMEVEEVSEEVLMYLIAGEMLHVGKNTSFGFGRYEVFHY